MAIRPAKRSEFDRLVEALILSLLAYTAYSLVVTESPLTLSEESGVIEFTYSGASLLLLVAVSIILPAAIAASINHDLHFRLARALRLTRRTTKSSVWFDVFHATRSYVILDFADGRRLFGWPTFYSDDPAEPFVYLENPHWVLDKEFQDIGVRGILVTPQERIEFIEFLRDE